MEFDVLIRGGLLVDGTGAKGVVASVGLRRDRIAAIGRLDDAQAERIVEVAGQVVAPGFIDVHVHSELARLGGADQLAGIRQGVTTELMAPDGFSWAPLSPPRSEEVRAYLQVFYGDLPAGGPWPTVEAYLALFPGHLPGNLVPQVPHLPIKVGVMGWETRPATPDDIRAMQRLVIAWREAGAVSLAAGLEYQPGAFSSVEELVALGRAAGCVYAPHQRGYWQRLIPGARETFQIGREADIPVHISHLAIDERAEALLAEAVASGLDVSFDMYPYAAACTHLLMMLPAWAQAGGHEAALARLRDPVRRDRLREETAARLAERGEVILASVVGEPELEGHTLEEVARDRGQPAVDALFDLLLRHEGRVLAVYHWPPEVEGEELLRRTLTHPLYVGSSDGIFRGSRPHRRGFGTFPRIVGDYVRNGTLTLEQAVHKVTGRAAQRFGLRDRGYLKEGLGADLVVFDPMRLSDQTTWQEPRRAPSGIHQVWVNGALVLEDGQPTGSLPGRILR